MSQVASRRCGWLAVAVACLGWLLMVGVGAAWAEQTIEYRAHGFEGEETIADNWLGENEQRIKYLEPAGRYVQNSPNGWDGGDGEEEVEEGCEKGNMFDELGKECVGRHVVKEGRYDFPLPKGYQRLEHPTLETGFEGWRAVLTAYYAWKPGKRRRGRRRRERQGAMSAASPNVHNACGGDPVNCFTGNLFEPQTDVVIPGRGVPFDLTRTYNSEAAEHAGSAGLFGYGWSWSFGSSLEVNSEANEVTVLQANGITATFFGTIGKAGTFAGTAWSQAQLVYTESGTYEYTLPDQEVLTFGSSGRLLKERERNGNTTSLSYSEEEVCEGGCHKALKEIVVADPAGRKLTLKVNAGGQVESATDPMGHVVHYGYESGDLVSVKLPGEESTRWHYKYDGSHRMTEMANGLSGKTTMEYDSVGRVVKQTNPLGATTKFGYEVITHPESKRAHSVGTFEESEAEEECEEECTTTEIEEEVTTAPPEYETTITNETTGSVEHEHFNELGQLEKITRAAGTVHATTETFEYNAKEEVTSREDGNGHKTKYGYDLAGDRTSERNADGDETKWEYNSKHELVAVTAPNGETTSIKLTADGDPEVVERAVPGGTKQKTSYSYDEHGDLIQLEDPLKHIRKYEYDSYGDRTAEITPSGAKTTWTYNEDGQVLSRASARGNEEGAEAAKFTTDYERDAQGRVIAVKRPEALGSTRPAVRSLPSVSGMPQEGQTLTALTGVWQGTPSLSYSYRWEACNVLGGECFNVPGGTEATLHLESIAVGYTVRVAVTASNAYGSRTAISATTRVISVSAPAVFVSAFGSEGGGAGHFYHPTGVAVDAHGDVWVADGYGSRIEKFSSSGTWLASYGSFGSGTDEFDEPVGVAIDRSTGNVYVADQNNNRVDELNEEGGWVRSWTGGEGEFHEPGGIAVDAKGNVWVTDYANDRVEEFNSEGHFERRFGKAGSGHGEFYGPSGVAVANGLVYVTDLNNARIEGFNEEGGFVGESGGWGFYIGGYMFPGGLAPDSSGNIYVADVGNDRVQQLTEYGNFISQFGTVGRGPGQLEEPEDVAIAPSGAIYVTDSGNDRVEQWAPAGKPSAETPATINGQVLTGKTLTAGTGIWTAAPAPSYGYQWERCNRAGTECSSISGATSSTYTLGEADQGKTIRVVVTASNEHGETTSTSTATEEVPAARTTKYAYDADGNLTSVTDPEGDTTKYAYNANNEPTKTEEPDGASTETEYDADGLVIAQTDGNKHTTEYKRDLLGQVTETIDPDGHKTTREYDAAGNLTSLTDPLKRTTTYKYDPANQLTEVSYSDGKTHSVKYEYNEDGERTKMIDGTGTSTYTYDQLDRLTETETGHKEKVAYEYNLDDQPTKITYPNGKAVTRAYNENGQLETITDWNEHTTKFAYDADGDLTETEYPAASKDHDTTIYNEADEPTEITMSKESETLATIGYTHNPNSLIDTETTESLPGEPTTNYTYDPSSRLTAAGPTSYAYDNANNITKENTAEFSYDHADQLEAGPGASYTYNEAGQRIKTKPTTGPATTYEYDQAGNLTGASRPREGATPAIEDTYTYNGHGLRTSETIASTTSYLTWDETQPVPVLLSNSTFSFIYGPSQAPVEQINNSTGEVLYLHHDQQGSTRLLTGSTGKVEGKCSYSAYGVPTCEGSATTPLGYDAQYTNSDTGLIYMRARTYDPKTAQFLTIDPLAAVTWEPYSYAWGNPVNDVDPSGLEAIPFPIDGPEAPACLTPETIGPCIVVGGGGYIITEGVKSIVNAWTGEETGNDEGEAIVKQQAEEAEQASEDACGQEAPRSLPYQGEPNSTSALDRGNETGQIRDYGPDGLPLRDFDFGHDHGFGDPHAHDWPEGVRGPGRPIGPNE